MNIISRKYSAAEAGKLGGRAGGGSNKDKRCVRETGKYSTRRELIIAAKFYREQGLSYERVGAKVGVSEATVSRLVNGDPQTVVAKKKSYAGENAERGNMQMFNSLWKTRRKV